MSTAAKLLAQAAIRDYRENPQLMREAVHNGEMRKLIRADVESAMRDIPTPSIFPNLRSAASQIIARGNLSGLGEDEAVGTNDVWAKGQGNTTPASSGTDWTSVLSSVVKSAADAGSAIFKAQTQKQTASKQASLMSKLFGTSAAPAQASMLGGNLPMLLMLGGVGAIGVIAVSKMTSGGKKSRRRSRR